MYVSTNPEAKRDSPGVAKLSYVGIGVGVSFSPKNLAIPLDYSFSTKDMPGGSGQIFHGPLSSGEDLKLADLLGTCVLRVVSGAIGFAGSFTTIFFQPSTISFPHICKAFAQVKGWGTASPGLSLMDYPCYIRLSQIRPDSLKSDDPQHQSGPRSPIFNVIPPALMLPADVLFDFDRADLKPTAELSLQQAALLALSQKFRSVIIEGHTDSKGPFLHNLALSNARARAVRNWLIGRRVPGAESFVTRGIADRQPIALNCRPDGSDNPEGRQKNRRVAIILLP